jgi:hypothetical protein
MLLIVVSETQREKKRSLADIVRMGRVQEVTRDFVLVHNGQIGIRQFHFDAR